eukprot:CAMPEP_0198139172 /NCGR_PEP_ID=MMETSP1443-20131203/2518_1 /TAXON_ID=186043 /ORGANISM="Entomoneis sp., Strain CCMP2396" /LENGTH=193 /DNA_ID=CAMNT_0043801221 /DNA_START=27 /DNA_END=611 /DNA_ORIENTATION=-
MMMIKNLLAMFTLTLSGAASFRYGGTKDGHGRRAVGGTRKLAGLRGKKSKKGSDCESIKVFANEDDFETRYAEGEVGDIRVVTYVNVPFYSHTTGEQLGTFTNQATLVGNNAALDSNNNNTECIGTATYTFLGPNEEEEEEFGYASQIFTQFSCNGKYDAITGGTGDYACTSGYFGYEDGYDELFICQVLCSA